MKRFLLMLTPVVLVSAADCWDPIGYRLAGKVARGAQSPVYLSGFRSGTCGMTADRLAALLVGGASGGTDSAMLLRWELESGHTIAGIGATAFCSRRIPFFRKGFER